jgi:hypothetical protein
LYNIQFFHVPVSPVYYFEVEEEFDTKRKCGSLSRKNRAGRYFPSVYGTNFPSWIFIMNSFFSASPFPGKVIVPEIPG